MASTRSDETGDSEGTHIPDYRVGGDFFNSVHVHRKMDRIGRGVYHRIHSEGRSLLPARNGVENMVSIIIPTRDNNKMLLNCLASIRKHVGRNVRFIVINNGNKSALWERDCIDGDSSWGFAHSCNVGAELAGDSDLLFLNDDTIALNDFVTPMARLAGGDIGIVGALLTYPNGTIQHCGSSYNNGNPNHPHKGNTLQEYPEALQTREVEAVTFACAYVTRECWNDLGGLDEVAHPFGYADIDFCMKASANNYAIYCCGEARLTHIEHYTQRKHLKEIRPKSDESIRNLRARWG